MAIASPARATESDGSAPVSGQITVAANKREGWIIEVPIAVSLVDARQVKRQDITAVTDLTRAVSSLNGTLDTAATALTIRGIGTATFSSTSENSVGVVIDGVALANASISPPPLFDIAQVEVLEGPQATLYGRNASAGLINIATAEADPRQIAFSGRGIAGSRGRGGLEGALNLPLSDDAALRLSGAYDLRVRTIRDLAKQDSDRMKSAAARARLRLNLGSGTTLRLNADFSRRVRGDGGPFAVYHTTSPGSINAQLLSACGLTPDADNAESCTDGQNRQTVKSHGVSAQVDADLGFAKLTSISAYRHLDVDGTTDVDGIPADIVNFGRSTSRSRYLSQELRLASPVGSTIDYVVGVYASDSRDDSAGVLSGRVLTYLLPDGHPLRLLPFGRGTATHATSDGIAAFGDANVRIGNRFRLIAGVRVGRERLRAVTVRTVAPGAVATFPALLGDIGDLTPNQGAIDDTYVAFRVGGQYQFGPNVRAYVTYTRGYKGGAVNDTGAGQIVRPEIPMAWEGGIKAGLLGNRLALGLSVFHTRVKDFQTIVYQQATNSFNFANAPLLLSSGATLNLIGALSPYLRLSAGLTYTNARYGKGFIVPCAPAQTVATGCETFNGPAGPFTGDDVEGNSLPGTPKWKTTFSGEGSLPLGGSAAAYLQIDMVYTSAIRFSQAFDPFRETGGHAVIGGAIGIRGGGGRYALSLYARNLFDERAPTFRFPVATAPLTGDPLLYAQNFGTESFRTVGVAFDFSF